jgi:hypothetical protein
MTNITSLKVSLTKHGAHKVADLIKAFPKDQILENTSGTFRDIRIAQSQTKKNLSAKPDGTLPNIWDEIRQLSNNDINKLVLISIIFSHHKLIETMIQSSTEELQGKVNRGEVIDGKAYTNFACILEELGFAITHTPDYVTYDLQSIFHSSNEFPTFVSRILKLKLKTAGWDESNNFIDECLDLNFHSVFSLSEDDFRKWLQGDIDKPHAFVARITEKTGKEDHTFIFQSGHNKLPEGTTQINISEGSREARQLHNEIQNKLFRYLKKEYGDKNVGTENPWSYGNVDIVLSKDDEISFFEIKTNTNIRICIRQALSQLLEYSYWPDTTRAQKLIIVSQNLPTNEAIRYIQFLRNRFNLPIYYQQFDLDSGELLDPVYNLSMF